MTPRDGDDTRAWRIFRILAPFVVAAIVLGAWQAWVALARIPQYLVPSPLVVAHALYADRALLLHSLGITLGVALAALALATLAGTATALVFAQSRWSRKGHPDGESAAAPRGSFRMVTENIGF